MSMSSSAFGSLGCSFWSTQLNFTKPISARHYCLLGNDRYTAPTTVGDCNHIHENNGGAPNCHECLAWDGRSSRQCNYYKGRGQELGIVPPVAGYQDWSCPVGYESFADVHHLDIACPVHSVLLLEILPNTAMGALAAALEAETNYSTRSFYDFQVDTPDEVTRVFEARQCLTGVGGRGCGRHMIRMFAHHQEGLCSLEFVSGTGYKVRCLNGFQEDSSFLGGMQRQNCHTYNGLSCLEVMQLQPGALSKTDVIVVDGAGNGNRLYYEGLCDLHDWKGLSNPLALLVGAGIMLITLAPSLFCWRRGSSNIGPTFLVGLLSEALKNGAVVASILAVDWECLQQYGLFAPSENNAVFLPYTLIVFSLADTILAVIALFSKRDKKKLEDSFDQFKWRDHYSTCHRRFLTSSTIAVLGGLGGFMQLSLMLQGTVESSIGSSGSNLLSVAASWVFIISASIGGLFGSMMILYGVYTGKMWLAWKTYKILVGCVPGVVISVDLAVVLSPGWILETSNDVLHILLYAPALWKAYKTRQ
ncbi:expressed unknown protein [Seminavis robusta]|uniref:Uncharacterized protein n=1 Tax=Seminavis robusta TaxID=568900 RepID=A0A9N8D5W1_9STRA|nr:expressed unknown protein [Seminavis robusta]|eukprot:Sro12_g009460.1 n/a (531) ;mRNA; f:131659-133251